MDTSLYTSTNSTTSFDTRPHEFTWIYGTNYAHARTVDTRPFFRSGRGLGTRLMKAKLMGVDASRERWKFKINESTEVHNPRRDCAILTLAHETHQTFTV